MPTVENTWSGSAAGSSNVCTISVSGITAGNLLVLGFNLNDARYTVSSITDNGSGSWVELIDYNSGDNSNTSIRVAYKVASGTETTISVTLNSTRTIYYKLMEISGCTSTPLDDYDYRAPGTNATPISLAATSTADGIAVAMAATGTYGYKTTTFSGFNGYSPDCTSINGVSYAFDSGTKTYTGSGSVTASGTFTDGCVSGALLLFLAAVAAVNLTQYSFRFRNNDGSESAASPAADENTNITLTPGSKTRIRIGIDATGDPTSKQFQLEYRRKPGGGSFGDWGIVP